MPVVLLDERRAAPSPGRASWNHRRRGHARRCEDGWRFRPPVEERAWPRPAARTPPLRVTRSLACCPSRSPRSSPAERRAQPHPLRGARKHLSRASAAGTLPAGAARHPLASVACDCEAGTPPHDHRLCVAPLPHCRPRAGRQSRRPWPHVPSQPPRCSIPPTSGRPAGARNAPVLELSPMRAPVDSRAFDQDDRASGITNQYATRTA